MIRLLDILVSIFTLILIFVPCCIIAFLIKMDDRGPVFFLQRRVGKGLQEFSIIKFRTMAVSGDNHEKGQRSDSFAEKQELRNHFQTTLPNDPRFTSIGQKLRPAHLDELPQFLNVLAGQMSVVGVRPDTPVQEVDYPGDYWAKRHLHRPGITGPAQLEPSQEGIAARMASEILWLENKSLRFYLLIIGRTIKKVISRNSF